MDEEDAALEAETAAAAEKSAEKNPAAAVVDLTLDSDAADNTSRLKARANQPNVCVEPEPQSFFPQSGTFQALNYQKMPFIKKLIFK